MPKSKAECGQLGGIVTLTKHGREFYSKIGKMGGRPRLPALSEVRQQSAPSNKKEKRLPTSLKDLRVLYARKQEGGAYSAPPGEGEGRFYRVSTVYKKGGEGRGKV